jgi:ElaB/YqjD/DUF883 family membrane-anchored ribosome-binding protein
MATTKKTTATTTAHNTSGSVNDVVNQLLGNSEEDLIDSFSDLSIKSLVQLKRVIVEVLHSKRETLEDELSLLDEGEEGSEEEAEGEEEEVKAAPVRPLQRKLRNVNGAVGEAAHDHQESNPEDVRSQVLKMLKPKERYTIGQIEKNLRVQPKSITGIVRQLVNDKKIKTEGQRRGTKYFVA